MLKKLICILLIFMAGISAFPRMSVSADGEPSVSAKAAVLLNADTGQVIYAKNQDQRLSMASTTKIMTALIALERAAVQNPVVTVTEEMVRVEGSSMGLKAGDKLTLKDLAAGMLVVSGNDAAKAAAIAVAGSAPKFAELMNQRADEIGMENTHFVTPSGLDDEEHYSTAYDMALLAQAAMRNSDFSEIVSQKSMNITFLSPEKTCRFTNHNKLLSSYEGCIGVKTGFTKKSGRCLVSAAECGGVRLIAVTLSAPDDWNDHAAMLDYGFSRLVRHVIDDSSFEVTIPIVGGTAETVILKGSAGTEICLDMEDVQNIRRIVEAPQFVYAPVKTGQVVGKVQYYLGEKIVASTNLVAGQEIPLVEDQPNWLQRIGRWFQNLFT